MKTVLQLFLNQLTRQVTYFFKTPRRAVYSTLYLIVAIPVSTWIVMRKAGCLFEEAVVPIIPLIAMGMLILSSIFVICGMLAIILYHVDFDKYRFWKRN